MTHDLICNIFRDLAVGVERLVITEIRDNTYFGQLSLTAGGDGKEIDCRPSDGIAIALRMKAPIFMPDDLLGRIDEERKKREQSFMVDSGQTIH